MSYCSTILLFFGGRGGVGKELYQAVTHKVSFDFLPEHVEVRQTQLSTAISLTGT